MSQILGLDLLPEEEVTDLVYQTEQAAVLGLLRDAGLHAALSLTEPVGRAGIGRWTGHVEGARRFTLDHFIALVETRAVNDILVVRYFMIFLSHYPITFTQPCLPCQPNLEIPICPCRTG